MYQPSRTVTSEREKNRGFRGHRWTKMGSTLSECQVGVIGGNRRWREGCGTATEVRVRTISAWRGTIEAVVVGTEGGDPTHAITPVENSHFKHPSCPPHHHSLSLKTSRQTQTPSTLAGQNQHGHRSGSEPARGSHPPTQLASNTQISLLST